MDNQIGIMQSRLTPTCNRDIQFYPSDSEITKEINLADRLGLDYIEWLITDTDKNYFFKGYKEFCKLKNIISKTNVKIESVCLDYLMFNDALINTDLFRWILSFAEQIGCKSIIIPIYRHNIDIDNISKLIHSYEGTTLLITFEFLNISSKEGIKFLNDLNHRVNARIGACFDIGNNCEKGVNNIVEELKRYNEADYLDHIHIKEKDEIGISCPLGMGMIGSKGWVKIFNYLFLAKNFTEHMYIKSAYKGGLTLQCSRSSDYGEEGWVRSQIEFLEIICRNIHGK